MNGYEGRTGRIAYVDVVTDGGDLLVGSLVDPIRSNLVQYLIHLTASSSSCNGIENPKAPPFRFFSSEGDKNSTRGMEAKKEAESRRLVQWIFSSSLRQ